MATAQENNYENLINRIIAKDLSPVYLLQGEESFFIDGISRCIEENILGEAEKSFNQTILYGKETTCENIVLTAKRFPMMASHQVIIVKEAQHLKDLDSLESYLENPLESTILAFCYKGKKLDKRKKAYKLFAKHTVFDAEKLRDYQLTPWVKSHIQKQGKQIDELGLQMLCEYLGADLSKIASEVKKLLVNVKDSPIITVSHIEENVGISKDYNIFELQKALGAANFNKSIQIINYFVSDIKNHPMPMVCPGLHGFFVKVLIYAQNRGKNENDLASLMGVNKFFLRDYAVAASNYPIEKLEHILSLIRYYEMRAKGVDNVATSNPHGQLMIEMVLRILKQA